MSERTGPRDGRDADDSDGRRAQGASDIRGDDEVGHDQPSGPHDVPAEQPGPGKVPGPDLGGGEHEWAMGETEWAAAREAEEPDHRRVIPAFLVGALAGMVALALVWATATLLTGDGTDVGRVAAGSVTSTPTTDAEPSQDARASLLPSRQDRCALAATALARPLRTAAPALDQWAIHVGTMNKLVAGAITSEQAAAFWAQTKVGAVQNLNRFDAATRRVSGAGVGCPAPGALTQESAELRSCAQRVDREQQALDAAQSSLRTWKRHIRDMAMMDMGHLSPTDANRMWLANWHRGNRELKTYRSAQRALDRSGGC
jgi:hypothetical protein